MAQRSMLLEALALQLPVRGVRASRWALFPTLEPKRDMILASTRLVNFNVVDQIVYKF